MKAPVLLRKVAKNLFWRVEEKCRVRGRGVWFAGGGDKDHTLSCTFCAENIWTFSDYRGHLTQTVKELIVERVGPEMKPKPESLWWTSTFEITVREDIWVGSRLETWRMPFVEEFELLGYKFLPDGKVMQVPEKMRSKETRSWSRDALVKGCSLL